MIRALLWSLLFILIKPAMAQQQGSRVVERDQNKDGIIDLRIFYQGKHKVRVEHDRNNDKFNDIIETYNPDGSLQDVLRDDDFDKKMEIKETYVKENGHWIQRVFKLQEDGSYKFVVSTKTPVNQQVLNTRYLQCIEGLWIPEVITRLTDASTDAAMTANNGWFPTNYGVRIHQSCVSNFGNDFGITGIRESFNEGISCITGLANQRSPSDRISGSLTNLSLLEEVINPPTGPASIVCNETTGYNWSSTAGHASVSSDQALSLPGSPATTVSHPYISINPNYRPEPAAGDSDSNTVSRQEFKRTIFHEFLHNLGYRHGHGVEYPYSCEKCCIGPFGESETDRQIKRRACNVCRGDYSGENDFEYIMDITEMLSLDFDISRATKILTKYIAQNPNSRRAYYQLLNIQTRTSFGGMAGGISEEVNRRFPPRSAEEVEIMRRIRDRADAIPSVLQSAGTHYSAAFFQMYTDGDSDRALQTLQSAQSSLELMADPINGETAGTTTANHILYGRQQLCKGLNDLLWQIYEGYKNSQPPQDEKASNAFTTYMTYSECH